MQFKVKPLKNGLFKVIRELGSAMVTQLSVTTITKVETDDESNITIEASLKELLLNKTLANVFRPIFQVFPD